MSMEGYLDERQAAAKEAGELGRRDGDLLLWLNRNHAPEVRLACFDRWLLAELRKRLDWAWAGGHKEKRVQQCRIQIDTMVKALWERGWMLDGKRLAARIEAMLDTVAKYQRTGAVKDFWPYFKATTGRYVGLNAEEIQAEARSAGTIFDQVMQSVTRGQKAAPSISELVAERAQETLRAKTNRIHRQAAKQQAYKGQQQLF